jgi:hypothetical protein
MCFRLFLYISEILKKHEEEAEKKKPGISKSRNFRYPPVLPIVFYDGAQRWTAETNFLDRTYLKEAFTPYIPKFDYLVVDLNRYSMGDICAFSDALSLIMLIDKLTDKNKPLALEKLPLGYFKELGLKIPPELNKLLMKVIEALMDRVETPEEEIEAVTSHLQKKEYPQMFEAVVANWKRERRLQRREGREEGIQLGEKRAEKKFEQERLKAEQERQQAEQHSRTNHSCKPRNSAAAAQAVPARCGMGAIPGIRNKSAGRRQHPLLLA